MKKIYQKPMVMIENFTVNELILAASGCGAIVTMMETGCTSTNNEFIADAFSLGFFNECEVPYTKEEYDGLCLHGPADNGVFTS